MPQQPNAPVTQTMNWVNLIAKRMLLSRKRRKSLSAMSLIAICGIAFGMAATLVTLSVITGFQKAYEQAILGFNSHMVLLQEGEIDDPDTLYSQLNNFRVTDEEADYWKDHLFWWNWLGNLDFLSDPKMEELKKKGIRAYTPFVYREGLGLLPDELTSIVLKGVDSKKVNQVYPINFQPLKGESSHLEELLADRKGSLPPVLLGKDLFDRFFPKGIEDEATVRLLIPKGKWREGKHFKDLAQDFEVVGTFESGLYEFDSQFVLTSIKAMDRLFELDGKISGVEIVLDDASKARFLARTIESSLLTPIQIVSWDELNEQLFSAMKMEKTLFLIIMLLIILIASFNVMGIIVILIISRRSDLAILRAMGAPRRSLYRALSLQGLFLGAVGSIFGIALSSVLLWSLERFQWFELDAQIYFISHLPVYWPKGLWVVMVAAALVICYGVSRLTTRVVLKHASLAQSFR